MGARGVRAGEAGGRRDIFGFAAFLACSWTWCIGMFLPVLLVRDLGVWSFLVFAAPNCVGAALMGWVFRAPGASELFIGAHRRACVAFSLVTIAFHVFFLMWMAQREGLAVAIVGGFLVNIGINAISTWRGWAGWMPAVLTYGVSLGCAVVLAWSGALGGGLDGAPRLPASDLAWLGIVCVFGFVFCPFLDLSFHLARQALPGARGTRAFVAGFCGLFLGMIVLTLAYAGMFLRTDPELRADSVGLMSRAFGMGAASALFVHISVQAAFTIHLHVGMVSRAVHAAVWKVDWRVALAILVPMVIGVMASRLPEMGGKIGALKMSGAEAVYRGFMGFYGLVFPGYVWICVLPWWGKAVDKALHRRRVMVFAGAVGVAIPMMYVAFVEREMWWVGVGVGVVLLGRVLVRGNTQRASG